jgi:hypothetical protein
VANFAHGMTGESLGTFSRVEGPFDHEVGINRRQIALKRASYKVISRPRLNPHV